MRSQTLRLVAIVTYLLGSSARAGELQLGPVGIRLGGSAQATIAALRPHYTVEDCGKDTWSVRAQDPDDRKQPLVMIRAARGSIQFVSYLWNPGITPSPEEMMTHMSSALPDKAKCSVGKQVRKGEGWTSVALRFECGRETATFLTSFGPLAGSASISLEAK